MKILSNTNCSGLREFLHAIKKIYPYYRICKYYKENMYIFISNGLTFYSLNKTITVSDNIIELEIHMNKNGVFKLNRKIVKLIEHKKFTSSSMILKDEIFTIRLYKSKFDHAVEKLKF